MALKLLVSLISRLVACSPRIVPDTQTHRHTSLSFSLPPPLSADGTDDDCMDCTPDELASLVREIQDSKLVKTHKYHFVGYKNTFVGRDLVTWLVEEKRYSCECTCSSLIKTCIYTLGLVFGVFGSFITPAFTFILS